MAAALAYAGPAVSAGSAPPASRGVFDQLRCLTLAGRRLVIYRFETYVVDPRLALAGHGDSDVNFARAPGHLPDYFGQRPFAFADTAFLHVLGRFLFAIHGEEDADAFSAAAAIEP